MDQSDRLSVKVHTDDDPIPDSAPTSYPCSPRASPVSGSRKRRAVASGMQKTLSKTSMLVNFLPTGTLLTFEMLLPPVSGDGSCTPVSTTMIQVLLALFHFTDSFRGPDGNVYYGFVTPRGLTVFKFGLGVQVPKDDRCDVEVMESFPSMVGVVCSGLFLVSPNTRSTSCSDLLFN